MKSAAEIARDLDAEREKKKQENSHFPIEWRIQKIKQIKGRKTWMLTRAQGNLRDYLNVSFSWHSSPTDNPVVRTYKDQKWACNCSKEGLEGNCLHISIAQELINEEKKKR